MDINFGKLRIELDVRIHNDLTPEQEAKSQKIIEMIEASAIAVAKAVKKSSTQEGE